MKLSELHDWHMFLTVGQLGLNVIVRFVVDSDMTRVTWHEMYIMVKRV